MAEAATSVAAGIAMELVVDSISTQLGYIWNYKTNFENLKRQHQKLEGTWAQVQHSVDEATRNGEEIEQKVMSWLDSVEKINAETTKIIEDNQRANMRCFKSLCPDLKKRYQHSKNAVNKADDVSELEKDGKLLGKVSYRTPPKETWHPSSKLYEDIESRRSTVENILNALRNPDINMVGVHGMGGIGKTTLAKEVGKQAEEQRLFDALVFVEISEKPDIMKIQEAIADKLTLDFQEKSESGRARALFQRCKKESKLLIILDNIWKGLDLEIVGIPFANDHLGCKLLLTARSIDVLSNDMNSLKNFPVDRLDDKEAQDLFMKVAGACIEKHGLQSLALDVAKECGGLPIAIVTVAKALKDKQDFEWKSALHELQHPSIESLKDSVATESYSCIKLSYDHLKSEELKSTFLLCSTMECTYKARIEDVLRYGVGLNLFKTIKTMEEARYRVNTLVRKLKSSSLLLDTPDSEWFSIHDVVRDVGRAIAFKDHNKFTVIDDIIPWEWKDKNTMKNCTSISLHDITELPNKELDCPLLQFLFMKGKNEYSKIPDNFFIGMPNLRVLHLIEMDLSPPPPSLRCLVNLQTLCLNCSWLRDIGFITNLKDLEIFVLSCKTIEQLQVEIGQLTQLRVLDLSQCHRLEIVPPSIISKLTKLEELYLNYGFDNWHVEGLDNESGNTSLDELKHLSQLTTMHICIQDHKMVPKGLFSQKLQRYKICIGIDRWDCISKYGTSKTVKLKSDDSIVLEDGVITKLKGIEELRLDGRQSVKNALYELDSDGFPQLKHFDILNNPDLVYIVDSSKKWEPPCDAFPLLETLSLTNLVGLEKICHDQLTPNSFCRLRTINVDGCNNLKNVFSLSIAKLLSQLQDISVSNCKNMKDIFTIGRRNDINSNEEIDRVVLAQLHSLSLRTLPKLRSFCSEAEVFASTSNEIILEDTPMPFFDGKVHELPNLKTLKLYEVNFEKIWHHQIPLMSPCFRNLTHLSIRSCHNLKYLFSSCTFGSFVQLQDLEIKDCKVLEAIIRIDELGNNVEYPSLKKLKIEGCPEMKAFIFNDKVQLPSRYEVNFETIRHHPCFQNLIDLSVQSCNNLKYLFSFSTLGSFVQLQHLEIKDCNVMEAIIRMDDLGNNELPSLKKLKIEGCPKMKAFIFNDLVSFPKLEEIRISNMKSLKMIWYNQLIKDYMNGQHCQKLCKVEVTSCPSLKNIFPPSIARNLFQLKVLNVETYGIEEIVAMEGAKDAAALTFVFPQLTSLTLVDLQELKCFYPGIHTMEWPVLIELTLYGCDKIDRLFALELSANQNNILEDQLPVQPLSLVKKVSSNLEKLSLDGNNSRMIFESQFPEILFPKLKHLSIQKSSSLLGIFQRSHDLESLSLEFGSDKEIFWFDMVEKHIQTKKLSISRFENLEQIWKLQDSKVDVILQNLEEIHVFRCGSLVTLIPPSACFQNLTILRVRLCRKLLQLVSSSTAKSLVGLEEMRIEYCHNMTRVVADDEGAIIEDEIINFSKLKSLQLFCLSGLISFCSWNYTFNFPSLERLCVQNCPKMKVFASGVVITPMLREIRLGNKFYYCEGDVNTSMQQIHEKLVFSGERLSFSPTEITMILQKFPEHQFSKLKSLLVFDDESTVFPFEMLQRSHNLEQLKLSDSSYKEIFLYEEVKKHAEILSQLKSLDLEKLDHLEHMWKQDSKMDLILHNLENLQVDGCNSLISLMPDSASFQNLKTLKVRRCNGLISLLSSSTAKSLVRLEEVRIECCNMLTDIVSNEDVNEDNKVVGCNSLISLMPDSSSFQNLKTLRLAGCNSLISLMPDSSSFQYLKTLKLVDCNRLISLMPDSASLQNLKSLQVWRCNGLISLLSSSTAKSLVQLENMAIAYCNTMTNFVATEDVEEDKIIIFSKLRSLRLIDLSSFTSFCYGNHTLNFPSLRSLYVRKCPKMKFFSSGVSSTPLLQRIECDLDESVWEGDLNTTIQWIHEELYPENSTKDCVGPST